MKYHIVNCSDIYYLLSILGTMKQLGHYVADSIGSTLVHPVRQYEAGDVRWLRCNAL